MSSSYEAILVVGFGGPEGMDDVMPFLRNVTRGRGIPEERLAEVAEHYRHFGGVSPINQQTRDLIDALREELDRAGVDLPIYWGNRNWHPMLAETMQQMTDDGIKKALALVLAAYSSYSSCRQYREDIQRSQEAVGAEALEVDKLRVFYNHPLYIDANAENLSAALRQFPEESGERERVQVAFTAHSIPASMAAGCDYEKQLRETCRLVAEQCDLSEDRWSLVYQSRSGPPQVPWLEPDILDHLKARHDSGHNECVVLPIGFLSDHMEVLYDLDCEAKDLAEELGMHYVRAASVGVHPKFVAMLRELIEERLDPRSEPRAIGCFGPNHDVCPADCCPAPVRRSPPVHTKPNQ